MTAESVHARFLAQQERIYEEFRDAASEDCPLVRSPELDMNLTGYVLALRFGAEVSDAVQDANRQVGHVVECITYDATNAHTTITDYGRSDSDPRPIDLDAVEYIAKIAQDTFMAHRPAVEFKEWLSNESSVILAGYADREFSTAVSSLLEEARGQGIDLRWPWGSHVTTARFIESSPDVDLHRQIVEGVGKVDLPGRVFPERLELCRFEFGSDYYDLAPLHVMTWTESTTQVR